METSDHIRPFFWLPSDIKQDSITSHVEKIIEQCWTNLARRKNGGYEPVALSKGWHLDTVTNKKVFSNGQDIKIMCVGPIKVPVGHQMYKEGHNAYVLRYPDHSFIRFQRIERKEGAQSLTLPDSIAAEFAAKGKFKVLEWDTDEGRRKFEESLEPVAETLEERQLREHIEQTRGDPVKQTVPYTT